MRLSVVSTMYYSAPYLEEFHRRASASAVALTADYEILLVNDGSPDDALVRAKKIADADPRVVVVDLSRNFGHHKAMMTGLRQAKGDWVFLIDCDLEESPEWLNEFSQQMAEGEADVVFGVQEHRKGGAFERWSGRVFYNLLNYLTEVKLPRDAVTARLMTRRYVDALTQFDENEVFLFGLFCIAGFEQTSLKVNKVSTSKSTYTIRRKIALLVNAVTSFSSTPLVAIFYIGICIFLGAILYTLYLVYHYLFISKAIAGWTSVMASVWLLGGLTISFIGIIAVYLSKVFTESKRRPYTIVREIYSKRVSE